jgi:rare lipoprotein A (peptidoglycan hydrolase)
MLVAPCGATAIFRSLSNTPSTSRHLFALIRHNLTMLGLNTLQAGSGMMRGRLSATVRRIAPISACIVLCALLANCSNGVDSRYGVSASPRVVADGDPVPKGGGSYHIGAPYTVGGHTYYPQEDPHYQASGLASWYGDDFHGRLTANREVFDHNGISAAHPTMPLPSYARVTNLSNGRSLIVRVNDRGPYHGNRIIDVSTRAADLLGFRRSGTAWVKVEYVGRAPIEGSDDRLLAATFRQDEPAPAPGTIKLAATRIAPVGSTASILRNTHYASVSTSDAETTGARPMSHAQGPRGRDGTDQFLNGRGLY